MALRARQSQEELMGPEFQDADLQENDLRESVFIHFYTAHLFIPSVIKCGGGCVSEVFSVSSANTIKPLSHESHPLCVCCHISPTYLCSFA